MKKISIITIVLFLLLNTSCSDYLDQVPGDRLSLQEIFKTKKGAQSHLASVYVYIPDEYNQRQLHEGEIYKTYGPWTAGSDEAEYAWTGVATHLWNNNTVNANTDQVIYQRWKGWYTGIRSASEFIEYVPSTPTNELSEGLRKQWMAEAKALRAIYYFYLVRTYGPVPLLKGIIPQDASLQEVQLPRDNIDDCFDYIISELRGAIDGGLIARSKSDDMSNGHGHIDITVARAFIIQALMYRASPLFNGSIPHYANLKNKDGKALFPQNLSDADKQGRWQAAANEIKSFLTDYDQNVFDLERVYTPDGKFDPYSSYRRATRGAYSNLSSYKELVFYRLRTSSATMQYDRTPNHRGVSGDFQGGGAINPTQEMVDSYFMANGLSPISGYQDDKKTPIINTSSGYEDKNFISTDYEDPATGRLFAPTGTSRMYYKREPRFYADITFNGQKWLNDRDGAIYTGLNYSGNAGRENGGHDYSCTGYIVRKSAPEGPRGQEDRVCILMRYAQIYLDYVEALNECNPSSSEILVYLNRIRERAGIPGYGSSGVLKPTSQDAMRKAIQLERKIELGFENVRYFDVRRWGIAEETQGGAIHGMNINANGTLFYERTKVEDRIFDKRLYFFPIPQREINIDAELVQNPGF